MQMMLDQIYNIMRRGNEQLVIYRFIVAECAAKLKTIKNNQIHENHVTARKKSFGLMHDELTEEVLALNSVANNVRIIGASPFTEARDQFFGNFHDVIADWELRITRFVHQPLTHSSFTIECRTSVRNKYYIVQVQGNSKNGWKSPDAFCAIFDRIAVYPHSSVITNRTINTRSCKCTEDEMHRHNNNVTSLDARRRAPFAYQVYEAPDCHPTFILENEIISDKGEYHWN
jgi:hypothetical protein